jgi:hypothetical protein
VPSDSRAPGRDRVAESRIAGDSVELARALGLLEEEIEVVADPLGHLAPGTHLLKEFGNLPS